MTGRRPGADDDGSTLPLVVFYSALALAVILVVTAATSLYLERKRLLTLADGAALAGAESFALDRLRHDDDLIRPTLEDAAVVRAVDDYLAAADTDGFDELTVTAARAEDGTSAEVGLASTWRPPLVSLLLPEGVRVEVRATARSVFF